MSALSNHQNPNPNSLQPDSVTGAPDSDDLPPDPLLQSGAFIDPTNPVMEEPQGGTNGVGPGPSPSRVAPEASKPKGSDPFTLDWLPADWRVEHKVRSSGATAGSTDRYYYDPVSGRRFRSKKEVLHFLETGTPKKNANAEKTSGEGSASKRQKKSSKKAASAVSAVNFDFFDVPTKVEWVLTDPSEGSWTPYIDGRKVPEATAEQWAAAFTVSTSSNSGRTNR